MHCRKTCLVVLLTALCLPVFAGQEQNGPQNPPVPTITFDLYWEAADPQNYRITADSTCAAHYVSRSPTKPDESQEPEYKIDFTMSPANCNRLFQIAKELNYFKGDFDYKQHRIANTGRKTLRYADSERHSETVYNWSQNSEIEQLTKIFQGVSNTIEHGRRLQFLRRFDKLGLDKELKAMEDLSQHEGLAEIQVIAPTLQNIADDSSVLNMARQRARNLLGKSETKND